MAKLEGLLMRVEVWFKGLNDVVTAEVALLNSQDISAYLSVSGVD